MIPRVKVPANFGRELINSPVHGNLVLNLRGGSELRVNSAIMSFNSPVIGNLTTNLCQVLRENMWNFNLLLVSKLNLGYILKLFVAV